MGRHVHHHQGIPVGVPGLLGPLAVRRGIQLPVRHHAGHPAGQGALQLFMRDPRQGARDGGGVRGMVPEKPQRFLQRRPVQPGEEGDVGHGGLTADQARQGQAKNGLKGMTNSPGPPGSGTCSKHSNRDSAASISSHSQLSLPCLCNRPVETPRIVDIWPF